ncbi:MAG: transketolase [Christensenellaceae bacterium]|jgi:transketolase|nr:transketolase [Christensenellaceae bacterium]
MNDFKKQQALSLTSETIVNLAKEIRINIIDCIGSIGVGHIGGCLSIADLLAVLYGKHLRIDPKDPNKTARDRLVCSKGHAGPAIYSALAAKGYFERNDLLTLNQGGTKLPSHCDMNKTPGVDMTAGSLGQGFSCAVGMAIGSKIRDDGAYIYAIIGDGESQEGQIWEAAMLASQRKLDNLIAFTDYNHMQIDGTVEEINALAPLDKKWKSFGFNVKVIDGHDTLAIDKAISLAKKNKEKPTMIILNTIKGKGVSFVENAGVGCHSMTLNNTQCELAKSEIRGDSNV